MTNKTLELSDEVGYVWWHNPNYVLLVTKDGVYYWYTDTKGGDNTIRPAKDLSSRVVEQYMEYYNQTKRRFKYRAMPTVNHYTSGNGRIVE